MWSWFWYFILYSFFGFLIEVVFSRIISNPKTDRKCSLLLPLCPVYGLGAVTLLLLPEAVRVSPLLLFPAAALICTAVEYLVGLFYERVAHVSFWDYSHLPFNIGGKVCLLFSLFWGVLALGLFHLTQPLVAPLAESIPPIISLLVLAVTLLDGIFTLCLLRRTKSTSALRWYDQLHKQHRHA